MPTKTTPSILLIGATGPTGQHILKCAQTHPSSPKIHAFIRNPSKLTATEKQAYTSIIQGDGTSASDLTSAITETNPTHIVSVIGGGRNTGPQDIREQNVRALVAATGPGCQHADKKLVILSSYGVAESRNRFQTGMSFIVDMAYRFILRNVMVDHERAELALQVGMNHDFKKRVLLVKPTNLGVGKPVGGVETFGDFGKPGSWWIDREDLAKWIVEQVVKDERDGEFGRVVNITGASGEK